MDDAGKNFAQERRDGDRRNGQRRDPRWRFDPLFAATIVNHIAPPEQPVMSAYTQAQRSRRGLLVNVRV